MRALGWFALAAAMAFAAVLPFLAMVVLALSPPGAATLPEALVPDRLSLEHFRDVLAGARIGRWALNSVLYAGISTAITLLLAAMAGYAFAKKDFPLRTPLFWVVVVTFAVPSEVNLIPYFGGLAQVDGLDTYWGLILPTLANAQAVFLVRQYVRGIPDELLHAAAVDGAGEWWVFRRVVLPLTRPVLAVIGVFLFVWHWNDFLWPLIVAQSDEMRTLTVGLATLRSSSVPIGQQMAAATISLLPGLLVFGFAQRYLVNSRLDSGWRER
ncbi:carbohydrate ABC transporter permease [Actinosynnema sp. NPDC023794]